MKSLPPWREWILDEKKKGTTGYFLIERLNNGVVSSAREWPWSSHKERTGGTAWLLIDEISVELPKDWGKYVDAHLIKKEELNMLRQSVDRQSPYGTLAWQMKMSRELGLESTLRPRGRPRKRIE